jgi:hypothetical protein
MMAYFHHDQYFSVSTKNTAPSALLSLLPRSDHSEGGRACAAMSFFETVKLRIAQGLLFAILAVIGAVVVLSFVGDVLRFIF